MPVSMMSPTTTTVDDDVYSDRSDGFDYNAHGDDSVLVLLYKVNKKRSSCIRTEMLLAVATIVGVVAECSMCAKCCAVGAVVVVLGVKE